MKKSDHLSSVDILRKQMKQLASAYLVTDADNVRWILDADIERSWVLVTGSQVIVLTDFCYSEELRKNRPDVKVVERKKSLADTAVDTIQRNRIQKVFVESDTLFWPDARSLRKNLKSSRLILGNGIILHLRSIKRRTEIREITRAARISASGLTDCLKLIRPGTTEAAVAAELSGTMRRKGASGDAFPGIVAWNARAAYPHSTPGGTKIGKKGVLLIDWGARYCRYASDCTRSFLLGRGGPMREIYRIVLEANESAISAVRPGVQASEIDRIARDIIRDHGYDRYFGHSTGHGVGLAVHELPIVGTKSSETLQPGMIVTIEPGIYLPGKGGIRIEDLVLVTERGHRVLSPFPKDLKSCTLN